MVRSYERLGLVEFGRHLVASADLDPIYIALNRVDWDEGRKLRWLAAYCAFYHAGAACWLSQYSGGQFFWSWMLGAAANNGEIVPPTGGRWPRGAERRHFRGEFATRTVYEWQKRFKQPEGMFVYLRNQHPTFSSIRSAAQGIYSVGDWMSFKMVDLVDACLGVTVDQSNLMDFMYDAPVKSLLAEWRRRLELPETARPKDPEATIREMNGWLASELQDVTIPHKPGKPLDNFCLETIWCKYGSHLNGHYPLGNDLREIRHGLEGWHAQDFAAALP